MTPEEKNQYTLRAEARQEYLAMNYPTLRDSMAQAALSGLVSYAATNGHDYESIAKNAYAIADAMLKERAKEEPQPA